MKSYKLVLTNGVDWLPERDEMVRVIRNLIESGRYDKDGWIVYKDKTEVWAKADDYDGFDKPPTWTVLLPEEY